MFTLCFEGGMFLDAQGVQFVAQAVQFVAQAGMTTGDISVTEVGPSIALSPGMLTTMTVMLLTLTASTPDALTGPLPVDLNSATNRSARLLSESDQTRLKEIDLELAKQSWFGKTVAAVGIATLAGPWVVTAAIIGWKIASASIAFLGLNALAAPGFVGIGFVMGLVLALTAPLVVATVAIGAALAVTGLVIVGQHARYQHRLRQERNALVSSAELGPVPSVPLIAF